VNPIVSGWQFNGVTTIQSGLPLQITSANNQTNSFDIASRPNIAPGASAAGAKTITQWFNTSVFSPVAGSNSASASFSVFDSECHQER